MAQKLNLDKDLLARAEKHAAGAGYSSLTEFVAHLIEKELAGAKDAAPEAVDADEMKKRLQGLGYID